MRRQRSNANENEDDELREPKRVRMDSMDSTVTTRLESEFEANSNTNVTTNTNTNANEEVMNILPWERAQQSIQAGQRSASNRPSTPRRQSTYQQYIDAFFQQMEQLRQRQELLEQDSTNDTHAATYNGHRYRRISRELLFHISRTAARHSQWIEQLQLEKAEQPQVPNGKTVANDDKSSKKVSDQENDINESISSEDSNSEAEEELSIMHEHPDWPAFPNALLENAKTRLYLPSPALYACAVLTQEATLHLMTSFLTGKFRHSSNPRIAHVHSEIEFKFSCDHDFLTINKCVVYLRVNLGSYRIMLGHT